MTDLRPSNLARTGNCKGRAMPVKEENKLPSSEAAKRGTDIHLFFEYLWKGDIGDLNGDYTSEQRIEYLNIATKAKGMIDDFIAEKGYTVLNSLSELKVGFKFLDGRINGTSDLVLLVESPDKTRNLLVVDLKSGRSDYDPDNMPQLDCYAYGTLQHELTPKDIDKIYMIILAPETRDTAIVSQPVTIEGLSSTIKMYEDKLKPETEDTFTTGNGITLDVKMNPQDCTFCERGATCKARHDDLKDSMPEKMEELMKASEQCKTKKELNQRVADNEFDLTDEELLDTYRWLKKATKIQEGIEALLKHKVLENKAEIEGVSITKGKRAYKLTNESDMILSLKDEYNLSDSDLKEVVSRTKIVKALMTKGMSKTEAENAIAEFYFPIEGKPSIKVDFIIN